MAAGVTGQAVQAHEAEVPLRHPQRQGPGVESDPVIANLDPGGRTGAAGLQGCGPGAGVKVDVTQRFSGYPVQGLGQWIGQFIGQGGQVAMDDDGRFGGQIRKDRSQPVADELGRDKCPPGWSARR